MAGTEQLKEEYEDFKEQVILWSDFSEPTETINVPKRIYFFPLNLQEAAKQITVQISKYAKGYWYSENFTVRPGEVVGKVAEVDLDEDLKIEGATVPDTIDYGTNAFYVDISSVNLWRGSSSLHARRYFEMLYTEDGQSIHRRAVSSTNWPDELKQMFNKIRRAQGKVRKPFKGFDGTGGGRMMPEGGYGPEFGPGFEDEMMMGPGAMPMRRR